MKTLLLQNRDQSDSRKLNFSFSKAQKITLFTLIIALGHLLLEYWTLGCSILSLGIIFQISHKFYYDYIRPSISINSQFKVRTLRCH